MSKKITNTSGMSTKPTYGSTKLPTWNTATAVRNSARMRSLFTSSTSGKAASMSSTEPPSTSSSRGW
ncbi:MAG: hypothetical protein IPG81_12555 [Sandaracinaceae bacterium]|nr:hypothetical protein [Sandaracinaceae bacterium]